MPVLYIDPTAAGLGIQMLLGGIVGGLVTIRLFWGRVFSLFRRTRQEADEPLAPSEGSDAAKEEVQPHR